MLAMTPSKVRGILRLRALAPTSSRCFATGAKPLFDGSKHQEKITSLCRTRGFVFPGSDIYGGLANSFDYGPLGMLMKKNIQDRWWFEFVQKRPNCVGLDSSILLNSAVWQASGHLENFTDPMTECAKCNSRVRVDKLLESKLPPEQVASLSLQQMDQLLHEQHIECPNCSAQDAFKPTKNFNLLFRTNMGATEETCDWIYLRPETAQGAYINFANVQTTMRKKLPFGIGQMGKSFRNEISPGHFLFRTREFEQLELQFFTAPEESDQWFDYWVQQCYDFLVKYGVRKDSLRLHQHKHEELAHYARATTDIEFKYPFGWSELWGIANRTNFDLDKHMKASGKSLMHHEARVPAACHRASVGGRKIAAFAADRRLRRRGSARKKARGAASASRDRAVSLCRAAARQEQTRDCQLCA